MVRSTRILSLVIACSLLLLAGCDSVLNLDPKDEISEDQVWDDPSLVQAYLNDIYNSQGLGYGDPMPTPGVTDEAVNTHGHGDSPIVTSNLTPDNRGIWDAPGWRPATNPPYEQFNWGTVYSRIRDLNIFIERVPGSTVLDENMKQTLMGEAYFLRAYFYHNLMKLYGGVPLVTEAQELSQDLSQFQIPRGSFEETVNLIVSDLDRAAERLDVQARRLGTASKGAALALKSRVLLYAASDLYNENPSGMAETGYSGGSQQDRWQAAKDAAGAVMDLNVYQLPQASSAMQYHDHLVDASNPEFIWARYFTEAGGFAHNHSQFVSPNGYNSWSGDAPTQNHVDAYEMSDGSEFSWDDPEHAAAPYENRDPRFKANVLHNGAEWRPRPSGLQSIDPRGVIQTGWYEMPDQSNLRPGLDTRESAIQPWNGTKTGYNLAKFVDRTIEPDNEQAYNPWPQIRYAEILLNYAEASAELGETGDALTALNQVRSRVGMPDVPAGGGDGRTLMDRIRKERQVELAFEGHRYFDVRRWMIAEEAYTNARGMRVVGRLDPNGELLVENRYRWEYNVINVQNRTWNDKNYFVPLAREEMNRNPELVQNPGY